MKNLEAAWGSTIAPKNASKKASLTVRVDEPSIQGFLGPLWEMVGRIATNGKAQIQEADPGVYFAMIGDTQRALSMGISMGKFWIEVAEAPDGFPENVLAKAEYPMNSVMDLNFRQLAAKVAQVISRAVPGMNEV